MINHKLSHVFSEPNLKAGERGATLIEAVLFMVIALGLVSGGVVLYEQASRSAKTNETIRMLTSLQSQTRALFQSQPNFGTASIVETLITSNAVSSTFQRDSDSNGENDAIVSPFGSNVTVTGATANFTIAVEDVPVDICTRIVGFDASGNGTAGTGIVSISDGTTTDSNGLTATEASTFCTTNDTNGKIDLTWILSR